MCVLTAPCHASVCVCVSVCFSLKEWQGEWRKEEESWRDNAPDPSIPPGYSLMPWRRKTLDVLKDSECVCPCMCTYVCVVGVGG